MVTTLCLSGSVALKAGANVSTSITEEAWTEWINQAEGIIAAETRVDWVDEYSGLSDNVKKVLQDAASSHAALAAINYDMGNYNSKTEAQTMLDVNYTRFKEVMRIIKEKYATDFIKGVN